MTLKLPQLANGAACARCSDNVGPLHDFTERFTPRFVELPFDVDDGVAAAGLALLRTLMEAGELAPEKVR